MITAHPRQARAQYESMAHASRIEGATPHELVAILYDELLLSFSVLVRTLRHGDCPQTNSQFSRAFSIIHALEAGLDLKNGGPLAETLAGIYRSARRELTASCQSKDSGRIERLQLAFADMSASWRAIAA